MRKKGIPLESFNLDEREFERCKSWSALIKRYSIIDSGDEVDLENLESHYADGNDEEDESAEDLVEVDLEDEENEPSPLDQSVIQMRIFSSTLLQGKESRYKNFKSAGSKLMVPLPEEEEESEEGEEDRCEMQNLLDRTIPKLEERKRKWKESGMLRVLNTFDEEQIEQKVGSWLRTNNSSSFQPEKRTHTPPQHDDEDDSLHSMDTARYVLSNRKPRSSSNCCNTMTIKKYRQLQSKRDALREKYALPEDELHRIRAISKHKLRRHASDISTQLARFIKTKVVGKESDARKMLRVSESERLPVNKRRKLLSKHRVGRCHLNRSSWDSSSSDEDFGDDGNDQCSKNPRQRQQRRLHCTSHLPYCRHSEISTHLTFSSIRSSMYSSTSDTESLICNHLSLAKPKKRASECCCYNKKKLCHQIDHLADTSTEDWLVENCDSPKKLVSIGGMKNAVQPIKKPKSTSKMKARKNEKCIRNNKNAELIGFNEKDRQETEQNKQDEESDNGYDLDSTFERELKLAVELSKQSYKAEVNQLKGDEYIDRKAKKHKSRKVKNKKKSTVEDDMTSIPIKANSKREPKKNSKKMDTKSSTNGQTDSLMSCQKATTVDQSKKTLETFDHSCKQKPEIQIQELVIKPNANVAERNENVFLNAALAIHEISPTHFGIRPQPKSLKIKKVKKILKKSGNTKHKDDETFLTRADKICNSTAVPDDTAALKNQFPTVADTPSEQSTKPKTSFHDEVTTTKMDENKDATLEDDADDCFLVTSTTEEPQQKVEAAAIVTNNSIINRNNSNEGMKDIMLYTPRCRDLAPTNSISDGVFNITEEHLSTLIGTKSARKFMKYYIGRRRFDTKLTVYYRPPHNNCLDSNTDMDSDVDELEQLNRYGELYASFEEEK